MKTLHDEKLQYAWIKTVPVMCGYVFLGIAFGISLQEAGFSWIWAFLISLLVVYWGISFLLT